MSSIIEYHGTVALQVSSPITKSSIVRQTIAQRAEEIALSSDSPVPTKKSTSLGSKHRNRFVMVHTQEYEYICMQPLKLPCRNVK